MSWYNYFKMTYFYLVLFKYAWKIGKMAFTTLCHVKTVNMSSLLTVSSFIDILKVMIVTFFNSHFYQLKYIVFIILIEYDNYLEMIGIPRLAFLKNGKCSRCQ